MKRLIPIVILLAAAIAAGSVFLSAADKEAGAGKSAHALRQH